jgi:hypothetical protein
MFSAEDRRLADRQDLDYLDSPDEIPRQSFGSVPMDPETGPASEDPPSADRKLPLVATVLLADVALGLVALVVLVVVGIQKATGSATLSERRTVHYEDLVVFFVVGAILAGVAFLLYRARKTRVLVVQAVVAALVLGLGVFAAVNGNPSDSSVVSPIGPDDSPSPNTVWTTP